MRSRILSSVLAVVMTTAIGAALSAQGAPPAGGGRGGGFNLPPLLMETDAFPDGGVVPAKFVSAGGGMSVLPAFKLSGAPATTVSYAVIFHDIDVSLKGSSDDVLHWIAWNIPASANGWPEGSLPAGSVQGNNLRGQANYMGPGAPAGVRYHHYVFELYALSANLDIPQTASRADLIKAMEGKIVAKSAYVGRFKS
jgi:Raf kinase inhibitor-like YbhB/YbcL family protein